MACGISRLLQKHNIISYKDVNIRGVILDLINNKKLETPFYIVNVGEVMSQLDLWKSMLPNITPYYAVKSNNQPILLETLHVLGTNFDCASKNEIQQTLSITNDSSRVLYANPCKPVGHIEYARRMNIETMTFDCEEELMKIKHHHPNSKLILRIAVDDSNSVCRFNKKFGCKLENVQTILESAKRMSLNVIGISFHVGSGCYSGASYYDALKNVRYVHDVGTSIGHNMEVIDIGGGFPGNDRNRFEDIAQNVNLGLKYLVNETHKQDFRVIAEPGRFLSQASHTLVLSIIGKKYEDKTYTYYLDDGLYGSFNCIYFDHYKPIISVMKDCASSSSLYKSILFGPTCDSMDIIYDDIELPELFVGDVLYVENFGAYTLSASSKFNGFNTTTFQNIILE